MTALAAMPLRPFPGGDADVRHERLSLGLCAGTAEACAVAGRAPPRADRQPRRAHHRDRLACARVRLDGRRLERRCRSRIRSARCSPTPPSATLGRRISSWRRRWSLSSPSARARDGRRRRSCRPRCWRASASSATPQCRPAPRALCIAPTTPSISWPRGRGSAASFPSRCAFALIERDDLRKDAVRAMAGFSFWGQLIVAAIVLTGVVNIALTSHHPPLPPTTPYRALSGRETRHRRDHDFARALQSLCSRSATQDERIRAHGLTRDQRGGSRARLRRHCSRQRVCAARSGVKRGASGASLMRAIV